MRDTTERPEGIKAGTLKLVGTDEEVIYQNFKQLLEDEEAYRAMSTASNPMVTDLPASELRIFWKEKHESVFDCIIAACGRSGTGMVQAKVSAKIFTVCWCVTTTVVAPAGLDREQTMPPMRGIYRTIPAVIDLSKGYICGFYPEMGWRLFCAFSNYSRHRSGQ